MSPFSPQFFLSVESHGHRFVVMFDAGSTSAAQRAVVRWYLDPDLPLPRFVALQLLRRIADFRPGPSCKD